MLKCVVCLCKGCDGCRVFCLYCDVWSCRCSCMESMNVLSCRCCMFMSCVHPLVVFNPVAPYGYLLPNVYCLWKILQIQSCLCVFVGPGFVSTAPVFIRSSASNPACPHGRLAPNTVNRAQFLGVEGFDTICTAVCDRCDNSTACRLCRFGSSSCTSSLSLLLGTFVP